MNWYEGIYTYNSLHLMLTELNTKRRGPVPLAGQEFARAYAADTWHIMEDQVC